MAFAGVSLIADGKLCALTASPIDARADRGYHLLVVEGYSRSKGTPPNGEFIKSRPFLVGGHRWIIEYYPNGAEHYGGYISVFLVLEDDVEELEVKAQAVFSFIDQPEMRTSTRISENEIPPQCRYGEEDFIKKIFLERSRHLKDDSFIIRCDIVVIKAPANDTGNRVGTTDSFVEMPPSDMQSHLGELFLSKNGADITFEVGRETFAAHRCVLAARSTVFKEQLFSDTTMTKTNIVEINDMKPEIFKRLLIFIYTDSFPDWDWPWIEDKEDESVEKEDEEDDEMDEEEGDGSGEKEDEEHDEMVDEEGHAWREKEEDDEMDDADLVIKKYVKWLLQLLEAGDRYDIQRLKSICAEHLAEYIRRDTVADIIVVAERRQCRLLKDLCVEFIKSHSSLYTVLTPDSLDQIIKTCSPSVLNELFLKFAP